MSGRASTDALDELHAAVAKALADRIKSKDFTAADLNVARAFLKDNGIEAVALPGSPLRSLADSLPFPSEGLPN